MWPTTTSTELRALLLESEKEVGAIAEIDADARPFDGKMELALTEVSKEIDHGNGAINE